MGRENYLLPRLSGTYSCKIVIGAGYRFCIAKLVSLVSAALGYENADCFSVPMYLTDSLALRIPSENMAQHSMNYFARDGHRDLK